MQNRTNNISFVITNIFYATVLCIVIWLILPSSTPLYVLLIPFFWFLHTRATSQKLNEILDFAEMNNELLVEVMRKDPNFNLEEYMEDRGYHDENA